MTTRKSVTPPTLNCADELESEDAVVSTTAAQKTETENSNVEVDKNEQQQQQKTQKIVEKNTVEILKDTENNILEIDEEEEEEQQETEENLIIEEIQDELNEDIEQDNLLDDHVFEDSLLDQELEQEAIEQHEIVEKKLKEQQLLSETTKLSGQSPATTTTTPTKININKNESSSSEQDEHHVVSNKMRPVLIRGRKSIKDVKTNITKDELKVNSILENTIAAAIVQNELTDNNKNEQKQTVSPLKEEQKQETENIHAVIETKEKDEEIDIKKETTKELSSDEASMLNVSMTPTCRLTRKSAAQELVATTRVTRNRHTSRSETPPMSNNASILTLTARPRRSAATRKSNANLIMESPPTVQKRKRAADDLSATDLPVKHIKVENKDFAALSEEDAQQCSSDAESFKIKQEIIESDDIMDVSTASATLRGRTRGRKLQTPTTSSAAALSPSTRTTRHTKLTSQSPTPSPTSTANSGGEVKRRRTAGYNTNTRSSLSLLKLNQHKTTEQPLVQTPDEDSKDSIMYEDKIEKEASQLDDDAEMKLVSNGVVEPLSVDTTHLQAVGAEVEETGRAVAEELETASTSGASGSEKAASLSPEMVSEGVNVLSVKQFYKKPKFLENNLGIEEDPKLGEIVQKVSSGNDLNEQQQQSKTSASADDEDAEDEIELNLKLSDNECTNGDEAAELIDVVENAVAVQPVEEELAMKSEQEESDEEDEAYCDRLIIQEDEIDELDEKQSIDADAENTEQKLESMNEETEKQEHKNKKTRNDCDNIEAKLKQRKMECEKKRQKVKDEQHAKAEFEQNNLGDAELNQDDCEVLSMIDAELKKLKKSAKLEQVDENKENVVDVKPMQLDEEESNQLTIKEDDAASNNSACKQEIDVDQTSSSSNSPKKALKDDDANSIKSEHSGNTDTNSWLTLEFEHDEETLRQKEQHLQNLGLLTHKAAEKRRLEYIQSSAAAVEAAVDGATATQQQQPQQQQMQQRNSHKRNGKTATSASVTSAIATVSSEYTGTLKTVIKLNRNAVGSSTTGAASSANGCGTRKNQTHASAKEQNSGNGSNSLRRQPLKMTFQKGRARGHGHSDRSADAQSHGEDAYYTIQNETEGGPKTTTCLNSHADHYSASKG